jgi:hypothetical protein
MKCESRLEGVHLRFEDRAMGLFKFPGWVRPSHPFKCPRKPVQRNSQFRVGSGSLTGPCSPGGSKRQRDPGGATGPGPTDRPYRYHPSPLDFAVTIAWNDVAATPARVKRLLCVERRLCTRYHSAGKAPIAVLCRGGVEGTYGEQFYTLTAFCG